MLSVKALYTGYFERWNNINSCLSASDSTYSTPAMTIAQEHAHSTL